MHTLWIVSDLVIFVAFSFWKCEFANLKMWVSEFSEFENRMWMWVSELAIE